MEAGRKFELVHRTIFVLGLVLAAIFWGLSFVFPHIGEPVRISGGALSLVILGIAGLFLPPVPSSAKLFVGSLVGFVVIALFRAETSCGAACFIGGDKDAQLKLAAICLALIGIGLCLFRSPGFVVGSRVIGLCLVVGHIGLQAYSPRLCAVCLYLALIGVLLATANTPADREAGVPFLWRSAALALPLLAFFSALPAATSDTLASLEGMSVQDMPSILLASSNSPLLLLVEGTCPACNDAKQLLTEKKVRFTELTYAALDARARKVFKGVVPQLILIRNKKISVHEVGFSTNVYAKVITNESKQGL